MQKFKIKGGIPLYGEVRVSGAKNAVLPIMAATLITPGKYVLDNVPNIGDIRTMIKILSFIGVKTKFSPPTLFLDSSTASTPHAPYELVSTMRASFLVTGALLSRFGKATVAKPGGCAIGPRPIDEHLRGFKAMGIEIKEEHGYIYAERKKEGKMEIFLNHQSVTGTENILLASITRKLPTHLVNFAKEPHVIELINFLKKMGSHIEIKDGIIKVNPLTKNLSPVEYYKIPPDYIEAGTFAIIALITGGELTIDGMREEDLISELLKLKEIGAKVEKLSPQKMKISSPHKLKGCTLKTAPHPGFSTDLQPQITALLTLAEGISIVTEAMYEHRFTHVPELQRMGANIKIEGRNAIIKGVKELSGAKVMASDIRGGVALLIGALAAKGESEISRVYHIDRGYEEIENKLQQLGASIQRIG